MNVKEIFESMDYGPAPEASGEAQEWIAAHKGKFGLFIDGAFTKPGKGFATKNPSWGSCLFCFGSSLSPFDFGTSGPQPSCSM